MKKAFITILSILIISAFIMGGCAQSSAPPSPQAPPTSDSSTPPQADAGPIELLVASNGSGKDMVGTIIASALKEIEQATNGRVTYKFYYGGSLLTAPAMFDGIASGAADIGDGLPNINKGRFPVMDILELPWAYPDAIIANKIAWDVAKKFQPAELNDFKLITIASAIARTLVLSNKPIRTLEDFKGLKIRSTGINAEVVKALGAAPVGIPIFETYDALAKGTVDGALSGRNTLIDFKLAETVKYVTDANFIAGNILVLLVMNNDKFNSLSPDVQKIFLDVGEKYIIVGGETAMEYDKDHVDYIRSQNIETITVAPDEQLRWKEAVQPVIKSIIDAKTAEGIPAQEIAAFIQDSLKNASK